MHFREKNILKNNRYHTLKHTLKAFDDPSAGKVFITKLSRKVKNPFIFVF